ncbi:DUF2510 domain-containing protein [Mycobacteroides franklinii]|nr:hypothetical protein BST24_05140 [Mycobacteroides franklinii]
MLSEGTMAVACGWYADPWRQAPLRWFDGTRWTAWTHVPETDTIDDPSPQVRWGRAVVAMLG